MIQLVDDPVVDCIEERVQQIEEIDGILTLPFVRNRPFGFKNLARLVAGCRVVPQDHVVIVVKCALQLQARKSDQGDPDGVLCHSPDRQQNEQVQNDIEHRIKISAGVGGYLFDPGKFTIGRIKNGFQDKQDSCQH